MGILIHFSGAVKSGDGYRGADPVMFALGDAQHVIARVREVSLFMTADFPVGRVARRHRCRPAPSERRMRLSEHAAQASLNAPLTDAVPLLLNRGYELGDDKLGAARPDCLSCPRRH